MYQKLMLLAPLLFPAIAGGTIIIIIMVVKHAT